ncbi:hypothetical protein Hanom_Chr15g01377971 [Helianthus anomalus]
MKSGCCATHGRYASTCQNSGVVQKAGGVGGGVKGRRYLTRALCRFFTFFLEVLIDQAFYVVGDD